MRLQLRPPSRLVLAHVAPQPSPSSYSRGRAACCCCQAAARRLMCRPLQRREHALALGRTGVQAPSASTCVRFSRATFGKYVHSYTWPLASSSPGQNRFELKYPEAMWGVGGSGHHAFGPCGQVTFGRGPGVGGAGCSQKRRSLLCGPGRQPAASSCAMAVRPRTLRTRWSSHVFGCTAPPLQ
jgi:hypothetical protein